MTCYAQVWVEIWGLWKPVLVASRETCDAIAEAWATSKPWGAGTRYEVRERVSPWTAASS